MAQQQAGAPQGANQPGTSSPQPAQMAGSQPKATRAPLQSAFDSGGAAIVFRDYASI